MPVPPRNPQTFPSPHDQTHGSIVFLLRVVLLLWVVGEARRPRGTPARSEPDDRLLDHVPRRPQTFLSSLSGRCCHYLDLFQKLLHCSISFSSVFRLRRIIKLLRIINTNTHQFNQRRAHYGRIVVSLGTFNISSATMWSPPEEGDNLSLHGTIRYPTPCGPHLSTTCWAAEWLLPLPCGKTQRTR